MDAEVAVVGAGVVGAATALAFARRGVATVLLEAEAEPALAASGTNSGILHTGFDSPPGELETALILRSAALRDDVVEAVGAPLLRHGALLRPRAPGHRDAIAALAANARANGVDVRLGEDGSLEVPGEVVTDPVAFTLGLCAAATAHGAEVRTRFRVAAVEAAARGVVLRGEDGGRIGCALAVNCAGLHADEVACSAGDDSFEIYPRKGEFLVFDPPGGDSLERILLPVPTKRTKGVLVFPTVDGKVVAGPTAVDGTDKEDWSVRPGAAAEILPKAAAMHPPLESADQVGAYAGLRPAGRGVNYLIGPSRARRGLINVAAIRSTGLTASLGIAEHVVAIAGDLGVRGGPEEPLRPVSPPRPEVPWWRRAGERGGSAP